MEESCFSYTVFSLSDVLFKDRTLMVQFLTLIKISKTTYNGLTGGFSNMVKCGGGRD